ncbi:MAG: glutathione S-transferase family protein [Rhodospirillaceae bacterium]|nr:glutathione S-transferase family protein [Rhodospirillaceae bacterium]
MPLVLHSHPLSSYCWKVLIALYETGAPFTAEMVNLGDPDARAAYAALWPTCKIPLLQDGAKVVPETSVQIEYLDTHYPAARPLLPRDEAARLDARLWDRVSDFYVMTPMQRIVDDRMRPEAERDPRAVTQARALLATAYGLIERNMAGKTWAAGGDFSIADCAAAPALFYAGIVFPFPAGHPNLAAYFERLLARPSVARVITEARPFFQYFPFNDLMPRRFLGDA